jgi:hypothetical protein
MKTSHYSFRNKNTEKNLITHPDLNLWFITRIRASKNYELLQQIQLFLILGDFWQASIKKLERKSKSSGESPSTTQSCK